MSDGISLSVFFKLGEACRRKEEEIRRKLGLTESEYRGLDSLEADEEITCREMSDRMGLSLSRGSRVIDRLFKKGYITRRDSPADRRCKRLRLSNKGEIVQGKLRDNRLKCEMNLVENLPKTRITSLIKQLEKILEKWEEGEDRDGKS